MFKSIITKFFGVILCVFFVLMCLNVNYAALFEMPNTLHITLDDLYEFNNDNCFGKFVGAELNENIFTVGGERRQRTKLSLKLFGFIPIKEVQAVVEDSRQIYLGGIPLGFSINTKGLIVVGENKVGSRNERNPFKTGDIITHINGSEVEEAEDIRQALSLVDGGVAKINIVRDGERREIVAIPQFDDSCGEYKLGLWVRDDAQGIGTLTFVTKDGEFGALGHSISDYETGVEIPVKEGGIYLCNLVGINKAEKHKAGELRCLFSQTKNPIGNVLNNTQSGVFGVTDNIDSIVDKNISAKIGNRMLVKLGKAKIISAVSGVREEYDIEIIKAKYQPTASDKSFVFRVIDKRLISLTGGIVQGMSGSPIIQNDKIIGAVTHVFLNDATKGYGIYIDWMMNEASK